MKLVITATAAKQGITMEQFAQAVEAKKLRNPRRVEALRYDSQCIGITIRQFGIRCKVFFPGQSDYQYITL